LRRANKEITDRSEIDRILATAPVLHLGIIDGDRPYVVPMHFGYADSALFLHGACKGRKISALKANPQVCFDVTDRYEVQPGSKACEFSTRFVSVIGHGRARFLDDPAQRRAALDVLMNKFAPGPYEYRPGAEAATAVIRIDIDEITGKRG
jgi:nitroimidazol reductase NimA-like FMN-containing flavoprotein (pyridoxamine 5'-phosphate oxidase superfamily)